MTFHHFGRRHTHYPDFIAQDIARLRRCIQRSGIPARCVDTNLILGTWHLPDFDGFHDGWTEFSTSPVHNLHSLAIIAEILRCFDAVLLQGVMRDASALDCLMERFLGPDRAVLLTDLMPAGDAHPRRLAWVYDIRRTRPSGRSLRTPSTTADGAARDYAELVWLPDGFELRPTGQAGRIDFTDAVFQEWPEAERLRRVSDRLLWMEFSTDRNDRIGDTMGVPSAHRRFKC